MNFIFLHNILYLVKTLEIWFDKKKVFKFKMSNPVLSTAKFFKMDAVASDTACLQLFKIVQ